MTNKKMFVRWINTLNRDMIFKVINNMSQMVNFIYILVLINEGTISNMASYFEFVNPEYRTDLLSFYTTSKNTNNLCSSA
jgi:hypothetical protein